jgi:predicted dehydrogenase
MNIKEIIAAGEIGEIRTVMGEYPQGWLAFEDVQGNKQGEWRTDPAQSGKTNALGDIGTHIENTVFRMTGLKIKRLLARMDKVVPGRTLDDNSTVMLEYENGSTGVYWASQIAIGHDNGLRIRIYGSKGSISWFQEQPEIFHMAKQDGSLMEIHRGHSTIRQIAAKYTRLPSGHTEGWFEAMGNFYSNYIECLLAQRNDTFTGKMIEYPTLVDGVDGVRFIEACLKSSENGSIWVDF